MMWVPILMNKLNKWKKRQRESRDTPRSEQYRSTQCQGTSVGISATECPAPTSGQRLEHPSQRWKSVGCTSHSWDYSSASMLPKGIIRLEMLCLLRPVGCCIWIASFVPGISMMEPEMLQFQNTHQPPENCWNASEITEFWCGQLTPCYVEPWYLCINKIKGNSVGLMA